MRTAATAATATAMTRSSASAAMTLRLTATACGLGACAPTGSQWDLKPGDRVAVTVVEPYDGNSHYPINPGDYPAAPGCGFGFDVQQGQVLAATVVSVTNPEPQCAQIAQVSIAPFGSWTWTIAGNDASCRGDVMGGYYKATDGSCVGYVNVSVQHVSGDPFAPSVPGQLPHAVMQRTFERTSTSPPAWCVSNCVGNFVVNLQRL